MYGKIENGKLIYAPKDYILDDGRVINNFNNSTFFMKMFGFKLVIDNPPEVGENQYCVVSGYEDNGENITIKYEIKEMEEVPEPITPPSVEERLTKIEKDIDDIKILKSNMLTILEDERNK